MHNLARKLDSTLDEGFVTPSTRPCVPARVLEDPLGAGAGKRHIVTAEFEAQVRNEGSVAGSDEKREESRQQQDDEMHGSSGTEPRGAMAEVGREVARFMFVRLFLLDAWSWCWTLRWRVTGIVLRRDVAKRSRK